MIEWPYIVSIITRRYEAVNKIGESIRKWLKHLLHFLYDHFTFKAAQIERKHTKNYEFDWNHHS